MALSSQRVMALMQKSVDLAREGALLWQATRDEFVDIEQALVDWKSADPERYLICVNPTLVDGRVNYLFGGIVVVPE